MSGDDWVKIITAAGSTIAALTGMIAAIGVLLSKLRGDKHAEAMQKLEDKADTTIKQNKSIEEKTNVTLLQNERIENKTDKVNETVNGPLTHALKVNAVLAERVSKVTGANPDIIAADASREASAANEEGGS